MGEFDCAMCRGPLGIPIIEVHPFGNLCWDCYQKFDEVVIWKSASRSRNQQLEKKLKECFLPTTHQNTKQKDVTKNFDDYLKACPRPYPNHHKGEIVEITDNKFIFDLDLTNFTDTASIQKFLKNKNKTISLKITSDAKSLRYEITDSSVVGYFIKHLGKNGDVDIECITTKSKQEQNGVVEISNLQRIAGVSQLILVEISKKTQLTGKILESMECPICNEIMKPPIFLCSNGHSYCSICKPQLLNCPFCRGELGNTRNYALEAVIEELDRSKENRDDTKGICTIITSRTWYWMSSWLRGLCRNSP